MIDDLLQTYLFKDMEYQKLKDVEQFCMRLEMSDGDTLIRENEAEDLDLYVLCAGSVEITSSSANASSAEVVISKEDKEVFGEVSWITRRKRTATVRCRGEVTAIRVDGRNLLRYMEANAEFGFQVMRNVANVLAERLVATDNLLKQILWNSSL